MELLEGVDLNVVDDGKFEKIMNRSIIVITVYNYNKEYFEKLKKNRVKFGVILLGDESYYAPQDYYRHAKFVFRNYWHKYFSNMKNVHIFPLGYKRGFWQEGHLPVPDVSARAYTWSFAGQITQKPTRQAMISQLKTVPNHFIHETFWFGDPRGLDVISYRNLLLDTIFIPSPIGFSNLDSFRLYEALECGSIPIVEKKPYDYFGDYFGDHPFLTVDSWDEAPAMMNELLSDPEQLEQRRLKCYQWWLDYKAQIHTLFVETIRSAFR